MRLGQLSRQLNVSQKEIASFIKKEKDIELKVHPNVKVAEDLTELVISKFQSVGEPIENVEVNEPKEKTKPIENKEADEDSKPIEYARGEEFIRPEGPIEKVKTEIPQLEGIKVVGKIDLPEFHKDELAPDAPTSSSEETEESSETKEDEIKLPNATPLFKRPKRTRKPKNQPKNERRKKVISEEERKKKELEKAEKARAALKKAQKEEARKKHLELVKSYQSGIKPKRKKSKETAEKTARPILSESDNKKAPTTLFGKIWRWMNTE